MAHVELLSSVAAAPRHRPLGQDPKYDSADEMCESLGRYNSIYVLLIYVYICGHVYLHVSHLDLVPKLVAFLKPITLDGNVNYVALNKLSGSGYTLLIYKARSKMRELQPKPSGVICEPSRPLPLNHNSRHVGVVRPRAVDRRGSPGTENESLKEGSRCIGIDSE